MATGFPESKTNYPEIIVIMREGGDDAPRDVFLKFPSAVPLSELKDVDWIDFGKQVQAAYKQRRDHL